MNRMRRLRIASAHLPILAVLIAAPALATPRIGIEGGLSYSELTREADPPFGFGPTPKYQPAWSFGVVAEQPVGGLISIATGLRYVENQEKFTITFTSTDGGASTSSYRFDTRVAFRSVELPVRVTARPFARGPVLESSVGFAYLLEAIASTDISYTPPSPTPRLQFADIFEELGTFGDDQTRYYQRWNLSLGIGTGWDFPIGAHLATLRLRYAHGLTDVMKAEGVERRTRAFELEAGWRW